MNHLQLIQKKLKKFNIKKTITPETTIQSLGLDSLDLVNFVIEIETELKLQIPDDKLIDIKTIGDIIKLLNKK